MHRPVWRLSTVLALAALVALVALANADGPAEGGDGLARPEPKSEQPARARFQLPKLFDFELYKRVFGRTYSSAMEEAVRRKFMLARAMRAFISAIKYKLNQASSFSALNLFSDRLPAELDQDDNKQAAEFAEAERGAASASPNLEALLRPVDEADLLPEIDPEQIEQRLERLRAGDLEAVREESHANERVLEQVRGELAGGQGRRKRDLNARAKHDLSLDELISTGSGVELNAQTRAKLVGFIESNNPEYQAPELHSEGIRDKLLSEVNLLRVTYNPEVIEQRRRRELEQRVARLREQQAAARRAQSPLQRLGGAFSEMRERVVKELGAKLSAVVNLEGPRAGQGQPTRSASRNRGQLIEAFGEGDDEAVDGELFEDALDEPVDEIERMRRLLRDHGVDPDADPDKPDEVFLDHRDSNCFLLPRRQGDCGSCYAFAAVSLAEWLHCKRTGKLVAFSEQYIVDCGHSTVNTSGCDGGHFYKAADFIQNYGLELRSRYPYLAREQQCPYDEHTHPAQMGFIRMELGTMLKVALPVLGQFLHVSPVSVHINAPRSFKEYGGGVWKGEDCDPKKNLHAVLIIGHGRQDGLEYWLIRNSHSIGWGEQGHMKAWKGAPCFTPDYAVMYGTRSGAKLELRTEPNQIHKADDLRARYAQNMRQSITFDSA